VSDLSEHGECAESLPAYALGALSEEAGGRVEQHLSRCPMCRAELESLNAAVDALPGSVATVEAPPEIRARLMEVVNAEARVRQSPAHARGERRASWAPRRGGRRPSLLPRLALAASGLGALILVVVVLAQSGGGAPGRTIEARVTGLARAMGASASLRIQGSHAVMVVHDFPAPGPGKVDELWVTRGSAPPSPAGTFAVRSGSIRVDRPVLRGDRVLVTIEPRPGTGAPTTTPFVAAQA
jgi:anti-sigma factor RsiW